MDDEEFPGGSRPTGRYTVLGNTVTVTLGRMVGRTNELAEATAARWCGDRQHTVTGSKDNVPALTEMIVKALKEAMGKLP